MSAPPVLRARSGRRSPGRWSPLLVTFGLLGAACSGSSGPSATTTPPTTAGPPTSSPGTPALVASLPSGCAQAVPAAGATVTFVAQGRGWAVAPDGSGLTCLFEVSDPGPFQWGPRSDRVVLGGLEVRGVGSTASRAVGSTDPAEVSWGRPSGKAVVFVDTAGKELEKALVGATTIETVTPAEQEGKFPQHSDIAFQQVVYHPSGLALGFVMTDKEGSAIWMSSNTGADPTRIVWSEEGTVFGPVAFQPDGKVFYYGALLKNGTKMMAAIDLTQHKVINKLWVGSAQALRLAPAPNPGMVALDTGTGCADRQAVLSKLDHGAGTPLLPDAAGPTSVVGWLDDSHVLVSQGACSGPSSLWIADAAGGSAPVLVVDQVDRAAVRIPDATPTPTLPDIGVNEGLA